MRRDLWLGAVAIGLVGVLVGCNPEPDKVQRVPASELPAEARAQLVPEAEIIKVEKQTYGETYVYRVWFQLNGKTESVDLNTASVSSPHAVFE